VSGPVGGPRTRPLDGKVAIVTGAGRGLGRAEALELARQGAAVVVNDFGVGVDGGSAAGDGRDDPARQVAEEIAAAGGTAMAHSGDVADAADARELFDLAVRTFGDVHVLVNNAGILRDRMVFSMSEAEWDDVIRVHLRGHFLLTKFATAHWRERSKAAGAPVYARIVNTSSESFLAGSPGQPNYAAAKAGIAALTMSVAQGCARYGVRANAICPRALTRMTAQVFGAGGVAAPSASGPGGVTGTSGSGTSVNGASGSGASGSGVAGGGASGMGAGGTGSDPATAQLDPLAPEHVAPLVAYLASPEADHISGQLFVVHGGMVAVLAAPQVAAKFDSRQATWTVDELAAALGPYFANRAPLEGFTAAAVLGLRRG
jgi:NAD(P)-dependent dehydrogenase (short-subunit alcohol dehydrogenase family)